MNASELRLDTVSKHFGGVLAVDRCTFGIESGTVVGLIGPNGAGKSTVFNLISGLLPADSGTILLDGDRVSGKRPEEIAQMGVGRTFQTPRFFGSLDVMENLLASAVSDGERIVSAMTGTYRGTERENLERSLELLDLVGLGSKSHELSGTLSGGELRMLEVARQLIRSPKLLLLDEPTAGVDPEFQSRLLRLIRQVRTDQTTVVIVEHNLSFLMSLAERVIVLINGTVLSEGTPEQVRSDPRVIEAYLGAGDAS